ncbi:YcaO-like family protein [Primorskyibacter sp. S187A]|uniref:YcaO-like family protein n=1 Tax=Primorskyibacter sp. S187A TaxID=3415130 RepID=UPI003C7E3E5B
MRWISEPLSDADWAAVLRAPAQQSLEVEPYWARLRPRLAEFGITRVADITGLDKLGLPVVQAVRPRARSNAVTQGKARSLPAAAVGAVLECLEMAAGEDLSRLPPAPASNLDLWSAYASGEAWPSQETPFVHARELTVNTWSAVPRDLLSTDFSRGASAERAPILRHSIGLGAGSTLSAALMHGLLECLEADARNRAQHSGRRVRLSLASDDPAYGDLLKTIHAQDLRAAVWALPGHAQVPVIEASVMERPGASALPLPASGFAARFEPGAAVSAALLEALQARLAVISGAREDITQPFYQHAYAPDVLNAEWARHGPDPFAQPMGGGRPVANVLELAQSLGPLYAVVLHWDPTLPLAITRIVAPRLVTDPMQLERAA